MWEVTEAVRVLLLITVFLLEFLTTTVSLRALVITLCVTVLLCILLSEPVCISFQLLFTCFPMFQFLLFI